MAPENGINTVPVASDYTASFNEVYMYQCDEGYELNGCLNTTCLKDATWSLTVPPTCTGKFQPKSCKRKSLKFKSRSNQINCSVELLFTKGNKTYFPVKIKIALMFL